MTLLKSIVILSLICSILLSSLVPGTVGSDSNEASDEDVEVETVTFLTEEDAYDEENAEGTRLNNLYQRRRRKEEEGCPPLPEPSVINAKLCDARRCLRDDDCSNSSSMNKPIGEAEGAGNFLCCYNGCIHSCLPQVDPPVVFDWLEETDVNTFSEQYNASASDESLATRNLIMSAKEAPESITLPGGCLLNLKQYENLQLFRKNQHVSMCKCSSGEVLCQVNNVQLR